MGIALNFTTPGIIDAARHSWLGMDVPQIFVGDSTDDARRLVHVSTQEEFVGFVAMNADCLRQRNAGNHQADNRPLSLIRLANATIVRRFNLDWLVVGDADTCSTSTVWRSSSSPTFHT